MGQGALESIPDGAAVVHVGSASFLMPWREFRGSGSQLARLQVAAELVADNDLMDVAQGLLSGIEAEMFREAKRRGKIPEGRGVRASADVALEQGPVALRSGKTLGLPALVSPDGNRYLPDPYRPRDTRPHPAMDKFDRVAAVKPAAAALDMATLSDEQGRLLAQADEKLASAERRKQMRARSSIKVGSQWRFTYGPITQAERDERRFAREAYAQLGLATSDKHDRDEVKRGRAEGFALAGSRERLHRREACRRHLEHMKRIAALRLGLPRTKAAARAGLATALREFRTAQFEEARAAILKDVAAGGRRLSRDGLDSLGLDPIRMAAALWFRELYARTERGARVASWEGRAGGSRDDKRKVEDWGADQITRKQVEAKVMAATPNGRGITALRLVAGEGRTINAISGGKSHNRKLNTEALMIALDVVADHRGMQ